jgi:hypothetical protein
MLSLKSLLPTVESIRWHIPGRRICSIITTQWANGLWATWPTRLHHLLMI